jgi:hypothetical protein
MRDSARILIGALAISFLAVRPAQGVTDAQALCRKGLGTALARLTSTALKEMIRCHEARMKAKDTVPPATDCNDLG